MKDNRFQAYRLNIDDDLSFERQNLLFDTNAIIDIIDFDAKSLLDVFRDKYNLTFLTIDPVLVELYATKDHPTRTQRQFLISDYKFFTQPLTKQDLDVSREIQVWGSKNGCFPSPTDLYLASILHHYSKSSEKVYLISRDLKDFPRPLFDRVGHIILHNNRSSNLLTLLSINTSQLK